MIEEVCEIIERECGLSLPRAGVYRSLSRLIGVRSVALGREHAADYVDALRERPAERRRLVQALMINDSAFFSDLRLARAVSSALRRHDRAAVWDVGCGTGAQTYTLAILAVEAGCDATIVGTDIDSSAIEAAREGVFGVMAVRELGPELRDKYFDRRGTAQFEVRDAIRRKVRFEVSNVLTDPAPGEFDLVVCTNTLASFGVDAAEDAALVLARARTPQGTVLYDEASRALPPLLATAALETEDERSLSRRIADELRETEPSRRPSRSGDTSRTRLDLDATETEKELDEVRTLVRGGSFTRARRRLERLSRSSVVSAGDPVEQRLWLALGNVQAASGALTSALRCYASARALDPVSAEALTLSAAAHARLGDAGEARRAIGKARFLGSTAWPTLTLAARLATNPQRADQLSSAAGEAMRSFSDPFSSVGWWAALDPVLDESEFAPVPV